MITKATKYKVLPLDFPVQFRMMKDWYLSNHNILAPFITTNLPR